MSRALARLGHLVDVFTRRESLDAPLVRDWAPGVRIVNVPAGPAAIVRKDDLWPLMPAFLREMIRFAVRDGARYDIAHGNFWMSGWVAGELQRALGIPAVQLFHALGVTKRWHQGAADTSPSDRIDIERDIMRRVDRVIATCPREVDELTGDYGADPTRIEMIPLGVDTALFRPVDRETARNRLGLGLTAEDRVVVYVGRILPRKDVRNVIHALAHVHNACAPCYGGSASTLPCKLIVVGGESSAPDPTSTPEIGELQQLAAELGVGDRVTFAGKRSRGELRNYYCAGDVAVTTPWYEPFGLTPREATASGRPVIGSDVGGIAYTVAHGETGLLVPPRDPASLAAAIGGLLADQARREAFGRAARARVETLFTWPVVAARTAALYQDVIEDAHRSNPNRRGVAAAVFSNGPQESAAVGD